MSRPLEEQARRLQAQGRRLGTALLLAIVAGGVAEVTLDSAETGVTQSGAPVTTVTRQATTRAAPPKTTLREPTKTTTAPVSVKPEQVAALWYAAQHHLPVANVRVLQVDRLSTKRMRVLLMVERAKGKLDSAIVTLTKVNGSWRVTR